MEKYSSELPETRMQWSFRPPKCLAGGNKTKSTEKLQRHGDGQQMGALPEHG
jgi:hypothetical protein